MSAAGEATSPRRLSPQEWPEAHADPVESCQRCVEAAPMSASKSRRTHGPLGFTLIELMIALAIMAMLATLGYRALASLVDSEAQLSAEAQRWRALDTLFGRLEADLRQAVPRAVRSGGRTEPAWVGVTDAAGNGEVRFSRAGPEFAAEPGSAGQRLAYRLRDGRIEVLYWPHYDQPSTVAPTVYSLVDGVARFELAYLDEQSEWRDRWPSLANAPTPRAVRVVLTASSGETIERLLVLR
jgi:general secretion pathway protein J